MTPGQTRVIVLLIVLMALEAVVHPGIKEWVQAAATQWNTALASTGKKS
jgi:hypothetical protein